MSGGSYDYAYSKVMDMVDEMERFEHSGFAPSTPLRIAFRGLLERVAVAMKAVEWVDSGDCSEPHAEDAIRACFKFKPDLRLDCPDCGGTGWYSQEYANGCREQKQCKRCFLSPKPLKYDCDCYKKVDSGHTLQCREVGHY